MGGEIRWTRATVKVPVQIGVAKDEHFVDKFIRIGNVAFPIIGLVGGVLLGVGIKTHGLGGILADAGGGTLLAVGISGKALTSGVVRDVSQWWWRRKEAEAEGSFVVDEAHYSDDDSILDPDEEWSETIVE